MASVNSTDTNLTCPLSLLWSPSSIDDRRPLLQVCIVATITHSVFWFQLVFYSSVRQKTLQWLYAYLVTDILLLFRFFLSYIAHTVSHGCASNRVWYLFLCYCEAFVDNYLNVTEVYILFALNLCRYVQIAYNRNVYTTYVRSLIGAHLFIYLMPVINFIIQIHINWVRLVAFVGDLCYITYINIYPKIFNTIIVFVLPLGLNILVIYVSARHVHLTSRLRRAQHHVSAREKYQRSLVIQFLVFYTIWLLLWSPNVIAYQFSNRADIIKIVRLLSFIEIALDPIIICALDVRFWEIWRNIWRKIKNRYFPNLQPQRRQIQPIETIHAIPLPQRHQRKIT